MRFAGITPGDMGLLATIGIAAVRGRQAGSILRQRPRSADEVSCRDNVFVPDQQTIRTRDERGNCCSAFESSDLNKGIWCDAWRSPPPGNISSGMGQRKRQRQVNQALRQTRRLRQMQLALYQRKCRLADAVRRDRTKHLIEQGGLTVIVGLLDFDRDVLFGALLRAAQHLNDPEMVKKLRAIGRRKFEEWRQKGKDATLPTIPKSQQTDDPGKDRKRMTRQLCELGGLIDKAGFAEVDRAVLLGILSEIARCRNNPKALAAWKQAAVEAEGEAAAAQAAAQARIQPVRVIFPGPIPRPIGRQLRELGLRYRSKLRRWEGEADPDVAARIAGTAGGEVFVPSTGLP